MKNFDGGFRFVETRTIGKRHEPRESIVVVIRKEDLIGQSLIPDFLKSLRFVNRYYSWGFVGKIYMAG